MISIECMHHEISHISYNQKENEKQHKKTHVEPTLKTEKA